MELYIRHVRGNKSHMMDGETFVGLEDKLFNIIRVWKPAVQTVYSVRLSRPLWWLFGFFIVFFAAMCLLVMKHSHCEAAQVWPQHNKRFTFSTQNTQIQLISVDFCLYSRVIDDCKLCVELPKDWKQKKYKTIFYIFWLFII